MAKKQPSRRKAAEKKRRATAKRAATQPRGKAKSNAKSKPKVRRSVKAAKMAKTPRRRATAATRDASRATDASNNRSGDFGIPTASAVRRVRRGEDLFRTHESHREPRAGASEVPRDAGVGAPDDGPGSHSGGDVSTDFTGVGTGGSTVAESGAGGHTDGPALANAGDFASGPPARGRNNLPPGLVGGSKRVNGSVVSPVDDEPRFLDNDPNGANAGDEKPRQR
jgi:hypothetical protein